MKKYIFILLVLLIPAFSLMLRPGIFTMHDFHPFRQYEFSQCVAAKTFTCRWAPDAGMGYGEPVFNFYGQFPYWVGQIFHSLGLQIIDSVKANFILTIIVSAVGMYLLGKKYWGNLGGMIAALFYIYAPYRAVDVWVRGSLNEAYALALFPFIFLSLDNFLDDHQPRHLWWLVFFASALLITHNLSALMIAPFLAIWVFKKFPVPFSRLIAAAAAVFLFFTQTRPYFEDIKVMKDEKQSIDEALQYSRELQALRNNLLNKRNAISQEDMDKLNKIIPAEISSGEIITMLEDMVKKHNLMLKKIDVGEKKAAQNSFQDSSVPIGAPPPLFKTIDLSLYIAHVASIAAFIESGFAL